MATLTIENNNLPKSSYIDIHLRQVTLETANKIYPEAEWSRINTDGSSTPLKGNTGAEFYCKFFQGHVAVRTPASNFDREMAAVQEAAHHIALIKTAKTAVFFFDS